MQQMMNRQLIVSAIANGRLIWRKHALEKMFERKISRDEVKEVLLEGELIEDYADAKPFPSALFMKVNNSRPIHVVAGWNEMRKDVFIITAYEPTLDKFKDDFKTRRTK